MLETGKAMMLRLDNKAKPQASVSLSHVSCFNKTLDPDASKVG